MNRHHTGSGRRQAIPPGWAAAHAPVADGTRNATVTLRHPGTGTTWDPDANDGDGATVPAPGTAYATGISARIQALITRSDNDVQAGEETVQVPPYLVTVDRDLQPTVGDDVEVTACAGDPLLVTRTLRVDHVVLGTERFERDLLCTLIDVPG